jgi:hypothetical protein
MSLKTTAQRVAGVAAFLVVMLVAVGAMNATASSTSGKEVIITDPTNPAQQAAVGPGGALRVQIAGDVQLASGEPVLEQATATYDSDETIDVIELFTVPSGKRLVVEHISVNALLGAGDLYSADVQSGAPFGPTIHNLVIHAQGTDNLGRGVFTASQEIRFAMEEGETLAVVVRRDTDGLGGFTEATVSGYLV